MQIQALLAATEELNIESNVEIAKPLVFSRKAEKVGGFIMSYLKIKMRRATVEEQIQWILLYVQEGSADIWKKNLLEDLEIVEVEFKSVKEFLLALRKEFGGGDKKSVKVAKLRRIEQERRTVEEFIQEFQRATKGSGYKRRALIEELKRGIND